MLGSIEFLPTEGGPGVIQGKDDGSEYEFFHRDVPPGDQSAPLKLWTAVEFDAVSGEQPRATNVRIIAAAVNAPPTTTGAAAILPTAVEAAARQEAIALYAVPPKLVVVKGELPAGWEIMAASEWLLSATSTTSPEEAKRQLASRAKALRANAVLEVSYTKHGDESAKKSSAVSHHYAGRPAVIARKAEDGTLLREALTVDLDSAATAEAERCAEHRAAALRTNLIIYGISMALATLAGLLIGFFSLPMLVVSTIVALLALKLHRPLGEAPWLILSPPLPAPKTSAGPRQTVQPPGSAESRR